MVDIQKKKRLVVGWLNHRVEVKSDKRLPTSRQSNIVIWKHIYRVHALLCSYIRTKGAMGIGWDNPCIADGANPCVEAIAISQFCFSVHM